MTVTGCETATQTSFEPTERMSTYLLALIVSDFSFLSSQEGDVLVNTAQMLSLVIVVTVALGRVKFPALPAGGVWG